MLLARISIWTFFWGINVYTWMCFTQISILKITFQIGLLGQLSFILFLLKCDVMLEYFLKIIFLGMWKNNSLLKIKGEDMTTG